ncbi:SixA phosphatase family protein [Methylotenera versatilis]|jgi:phosphohistidine phosphatase|uniref:Putative phosphohistidine phosphatase, SixA n=1 Tax=Methylotenera versatilis (strain 301) TaxID=666681 RepID=D7DJU7_METV0|nr:histidine phosphatase family protein [Methylotenera versatilis]ADI30308.1 putative phosphohistidine phosphatase, SixA [Methylotenera versatilis 301]
MANLILWRHAEAEDHSKSGADFDRVLTKTGHKDAAKMAKWLNQHLPANTEALCSPAVRCLQTVAALQALSSINVEVVDYLSVDSTPEIIASKVCNDDSSRTILIIGHQPNLGTLITKLLGMSESACAVKKGAVWWLRQRVNEGVMQTYLYAVKHPNL